MLLNNVRKKRVNQMIDTFFDKNTLLKTPLQPDICQYIHLAALRTIISGRYSESWPEHINILDMQQIVKYYGWEYLILNSNDISRIFEGVSLAIYQCIDNLYCSRIGRSVHMVWRIIGEMAKRTEVAIPSYEAVWAICMYLTERHAKQTAVTTRVLDTTWHLIQITPPIRVVDRNSLIDPSIICVVDERSLRVLSFTSVPEVGTKNGMALALYDAIIAQRRPSREGAAGVLWPLPSHLLVHYDASNGVTEFCVQCGISLKSSNHTLAMRAELEHAWTKDLINRVLHKQHFMLLFDTYLKRMHGYGPIDARQEADRRFMRHRGYNQDPAWLFPKLRILLPAYETTITPDGLIQHNGLHYKDEILDYWPNQPVIFRRSAHAESSGWVYLNGEILCQSMARELRRTDGSYRPNRFHR